MFELFSTYLKILEVLCNVQLSRFSSCLAGLCLGVRSRDARPDETLGTPMPIVQTWNKHLKEEEKKETCDEALWVGKGGGDI